MNNVISKNIDKFKSVFVSVNFFLPLGTVNASRNALLALVMKKVSQNYKSEKELERKLASLYDTRLDIDIDKFSNSLCLKYTLECINDVRDIDVVNEAVGILYDIILNPKIVVQNGISTFPKDIVEREKQNLLQKIAEERDNKRKYALKQLERHMFESSGYGISLLGNVDTVSETSGADLFSHYEYMLKNANIVVEAVGNLAGHENLANNIYEYILKNINNKPCFDCKREIDNFETRNVPKIDKELQDINQSVLTIGCSLGNIDKEDTYKAMVYAQVLGGSPASKLFQNVREKESLAYFAKATYNRQKEVIYLFSGIAPENYEKAQKVMLQQLEEIKKGKVSDIELNAAKQNILFAYNDIKDSKYEFAKIILANELYFDSPIEIDEILKKVSDVSLEDIVNIANKLSVEQVFLLGGRENEQ